MKTPDTTAGELTDHIMCNVRSKLPELPTHEYNRIFEAVLEELQCHVLPMNEAQRRKFDEARPSNAKLTDAASAASSATGVTD